YSRVVGKVRVHVLDRLFLHFVSESDCFREERKSRGKTANTSASPSEYLGHGSEIAPRIVANKVPVGANDLRGEEWKIMSTLNPLFVFRMNNFGMFAKQVIE